MCDNFLDYMINCGCYKPGEGGQLVWNCKGWNPVVLTLSGEDFLKNCLNWGEKAPDCLMLIEDASNQLVIILAVELKARAKGEVGQKFDAFYRFAVGISRSITRVCDQFLGCVIFATVIITVRGMDALTKRKFLSDTHRILKRLKGVKSAFGNLNVQVVPQPIIKVGETVRFSFVYADIRRLLSNPSLPRC